MSAALLLVMVLSLAPQVLVCGTVEKHKCACCSDGPDCSCCTVAPLYPDQAAASTQAARVTVPDAWTPVTELHSAPVGTTLAAGPLAIAAHAPPLLLQTTQLRI